MSEKPAIVADGVSKIYRLYHERNASLKAALMRGRRARYEEFWALRDVSFEVPQGGVLGIIGDNGSGKSTMLKCLARILRPEEGTITTNGKISALLELGAGFHPELSGRENVYLNGSILGLTKRELDARFDDIVSFAGIEQFIDAPVKNYSSGMYVRLGFSVAINVDPDILLVDEVLAVGDAEFQRRCFDKFRELRKQKTTIVIVTHSLSSVRELCDVVGVLDHGRLRALGPTDEVVDGYLNRVFQQVEPTSRATGERSQGVDRIELLDGSGRPVGHVQSGQPVTVRLHYDVVEPVEAPVFVIEVRSVDGLEVARTSTEHADVELERITSGGHIDFRLERLLLVPGIYDVNAVLGDGSSAVGESDRERITVVSTDSEGEYGLFVLGGHWELSTNRTRP